MQALLAAPLPTTGNRDHSCLLPEHDDESASMSVSADGRWRCHVCNVGGDAAHLVAYLHGWDTEKQFPRVAAEVHRLASSGAQFDDARAAATSASGSEPLAALRTGVHADALAIEFLTSRGLSVDGALQRGLVIEAAPTPALVFTLDDPKGKVAGRVRRFLDGDTRYKLSKSRDTKQLPLFRAYSEPPTHPYVVLTEGILDALAVAELGHPAASLPNGAGSVKACADSIVALARSVETIYVATDGDDAGERAAREIANLLIDERVALRRVQYPTGTKDLNEVLQLDPGLVDPHLEVAPSLHAPLAPASWLDAPDWSERTEPEPAWLIDGLVREGDRVFLIGVGESQKTMFARAIAVAAAREEGAESRVGPYIVRGGHGVLFINEELPAPDARRHLVRFGRGMDAMAALLRIRPAHQTGITLGDATSLDRIERALAQLGPHPVLIVDSFRHVLGGIDENNGSAVAAALHRLDPVLMRTGATLFVIAHEAKAQTSPKLAMAGSTAPQGWADVQLRFERKKREPTEISVTKGRNLRGVPDEVSFEVADVGDDGLMLVVPTGKRIRRHVVLGARFSKLALEIRSALEGADAPISGNEIRKLIGKPHLKYDVLNPALAELRDAGAVVAAPGAGGHDVYSIRPTGAPSVGASSEGSTREAPRADTGSAEGSGP
jgi:hypothetical protein